MKGVKSFEKEGKKKDFFEYFFIYFDCQSQKPCSGPEQVTNKIRSNKMFKKNNEKKINKIVIYFFITC